jgi:hypothetical protein
MSPTSTPGPASPSHSHAIFKVLKLDALIWSSDEYRVEVSPPVMLGHSPFCCAFCCASPGRPAMTMAMMTAIKPARAWGVQLCGWLLFMGPLKRPTFARAISSERGGQAPTIRSRDS